MVIRYLTATLLLVFATAVILAGCASTATSQPGDQDGPTDLPASGESPDQQENETTEEPAAETPDRLEVRLTQTPAAGPERVEIPEIEPMTGEVPSEIMEEILDDLVERSGAEAGEIKVLRAEAVVWNDGSLGCPKPGEAYIQVLVTGYWVIVQVEGVEYDYRTSDSGHFKLCEGESTPANPPPEMNEQSQNPLVIQAKEDLAERLGIQINDIELLKIEEVTWPDASLGCPQFGMVYIQVPHDGMQIRLRAMGRVYDYHSGGNRDVFLCEQVFKVKPTTPKIDPTKHIPPPPDSGEQ
jgi:hypothetical protein